MLGEGASRLSAGHEARQEDIRRRPDDARDRAELARSDCRQDVRRRD